MRRKGVWPWLPWWGAPRGMTWHGLTWRASTLSARSRSFGLHKVLRCSKTPNKFQRGIIRVSSCWLCSLSILCICVQFIAWWLWLDAAQAMSAWPDSGVSNARFSRDCRDSLHHRAGDGRAPLNKFELMEVPHWWSVGEKVARWRDHVMFHPRAQEYPKLMQMRPLQYSTRKDRVKPYEKGSGRNPANRPNRCEDLDSAFRLDGQIWTGDSLSAATWRRSKGQQIETRFEPTV